MPSIACLLPFVTGEKETQMVQPSPARTSLPQLLVCSKSPGFAPVIKILLMVKLGPLFWRHTPFGVLVVLISWAGNPSLVAQRLTKDWYIEAILLIKPVSAPSLLYDD